MTPARFSRLALVLVEGARVLDRQRAHGAAMVVSRRAIEERGSCAPLA